MVFAFTASLADTAIHKLDDLLKTQYSGISTTPNRFSQIKIQADPANGGNVFVGDAKLTSTNYGKQLASSAILEFQSEQNNLSSLDIFVLASAATQKINVILMGN